MAAATPAPTPIHEKVLKHIKSFLISVCIAWVCWELIVRFVPLGYQQVITWQINLNDWARGWAGPVVTFWGNYIAGGVNAISPYLGISIFSVVLKRLINLIIKFIKKF